MRFDRLIPAVAGLLACAGAAAADLEPAMGVRLSFDGHGVYPAHLGLRLDYANRGLLAREDSLRLPAAMEWAVDGTAGRLAIYANGLPVALGPMLRVSQSEEAPAAEESSFWQGWGFNTGTLLLAGGAGVALMVAAAGNSAEKNNPTVNGPDPETPPSDGPSICTLDTICLP